MRAAHLSLALLIGFGLAARAWAGSTTRPTSRPAEVRADREYLSRMAKLDADYRAKRIEVLSRYLADLTAVKKDVVHSGDIDAAERVFEKASEIRDELASLVPQKPVDLKPAQKIDLKISQFFGVEGFANTIHVDGSEVVVTGENDFGKPAVEKWRAKLPEDQRDELTRFFREFPMNTIADVYEDPNTFDGLQVSFSIRIGDGPARKIMLRNRRQRDLERLIDEVNSLTPPKYWVLTNAASQYRSGHFGSP